MRRTLLITNDFPPRTGGIQSYVITLAHRLPADSLVVYAPSFPGDAEFDARQPFPVIRHPGGLLLPGVDVRKRAAELVREHRVQALWFGAAAPLALLAPRLRSEGIVRTVASTHGHEVGWAMVPGARQALRAIGRGNDVVTYVSEFARRRISAALGPQAALEYLPPGVVTDRFRPDPDAARAVRTRYGLGERPVVVCVSRLVPRKGQDVLLRALPAVADQVPDVRLLVVGDGPDAGRLARLARHHAVSDRVVFAGMVPAAELAAHYAAGDAFAMPCRTRGAGLDVEGLGIVFLEASATGLPVLAGDSGGAPETVRPGRTGVVVDGRRPTEVARELAGLLNDPERRQRWGRAGRAWVCDAWNWDRSGRRLADLLSG
ncbi:glycosyltransferase family 4 protein [Nakamurella flava]|uniref:Glycosyltransferase family 4 protein n=1 Tax=Nakamurella flava TaxID=2576308 RepID=A0A4U6QJI8_9ACTN|nr:glycosyltransferase family 4 protein [Nakamurella flava]TKV60461.1 glycosyltransferase family 4 protein [Nakamurella flava]